MYTIFWFSFVNCSSIYMSCSPVIPTHSLTQNNENLSCCFFLRPPHSSPSKSLALPSLLLGKEKSESFLLFPLCSNSSSSLLDLVGFLQYNYKRWHFILWEKCLGYIPAKWMGGFFIMTYFCDPTGKTFTFISSCLLFSYQIFSF